MGGASSDYTEAKAKIPNDGLDDQLSMLAEPECYSYIESDRLY